MTDHQKQRQMLCGDDRLWAIILAKAVTISFITADELQRKKGALGRRIFPSKTLVVPTLTATRESVKCHS